MGKRKVAATVKLRAYSVIADAVELAVSRGIRNAYKHADNRSIDEELERVSEHVSAAVMDGLCEILDFGDEE